MLFRSILAATDDSQIVVEVLRSLGPAGATFIVMWQWLQSERKGRLEAEQREREAYKATLEIAERTLPVMQDFTKATESRIQEKIEQARTLAPLSSQVDRLEDIAKRLKGDG